MNPAIISNIAAARDALMRDYPALADDPEFLADVIEGETEAPAIAAKLIQRRNEARANRDACKSLSQDYAAKASAWELRSTAQNRMLMALMDAAGVSKLSTPVGTVSVLDGKESLKLAADFEPPQGYFTTQIVADKKAIESALKAGETMPGAWLERGNPYVMVR
jgi:hypothetical protein